MMRALSWVTVSIAAHAGMEPLRTSQWPRPKSGYLTPSETEYFCVPAAEFTIDASSKMACETTPSPITQSLSDLTQWYSVDGCTGTKSIKQNIVISYQDCAQLGPGIDESYTLTVDSMGSVSITAPNQFGVRHGLVSLGNLFEARWKLWAEGEMADNFKYLKNPADKDTYYVLPYTEVNIQDAPRLEHRGIMLDTSRTIIPADQIKRTIKAMGMVKLNVLHWHLSDDQSFPAIFDTAPNGFMNTLQGPKCSPSATGYCLGLMSPEGHFTDKDLKDIVSLGEAHGVRVIFEVDQPAHAASWCAANRDLLFNAGGWVVLDIKDKSAEIWEKLGKPILDHISTIALPGEHFHYGADEFDVKIFGEDVDATVFVREWIDRVSDAVVAKNRRPISWQDGLQDGISTNTIAQIWDKAEKALEILNTGHDILWSSNTPMYLDCGKGHQFVPDLVSWCGDYNTWFSIFTQTPDLLLHNDPGYDAEKAGKVIGGEVPLWNESRNRHEQDVGMWPRAAAWAGAAWEAREEVLVSPMDAEDRETLAKGITAAVEAQTQLGYVVRKVRLFHDMPVAAFFQDYCLFKNSALCDASVGAWYQTNFEEKLTSTTTPEPVPATCGAGAQVALGAAALVGALSL